MTPSIRRQTALLYAPVETFDLGRGPTALAIDLCRRHGFALTAMLLSAAAAIAASPKGRTHEQLVEDSTALDARNLANAADLARTCAEGGIDLVQVTAIDHSRGFMPFVDDHARLHDLAIIGTADTGLLGERLVAESLLFESGRPVLLVPGNHTGPFTAGKIAVAWDNSRPVARSLGDALALLPGVAEVIFITIGDEKAISSSVTEDQRLQCVARRGLAVSEVRREKGKRTIGAALQETAQDLGADLLVMGAYGHSRMRQFFLGGATLGVLDDLRLPVLMAH